MWPHLSLVEANSYASLVSNSHVYQQNRSPHSFPCYIEDSKTCLARALLFEKRHFLKKQAKIHPWFCNAVAQSWSFIWLGIDNFPAEERERRCNWTSATVTPTPVFPYWALVASISSYWRRLLASLCSDCRGLNQLDTQVKRLSDAKRNKEHHSSLSDYNVGNTGEASAGALGRVFSRSHFPAQIWNELALCPMTD